MQRRGQRGGPLRVTLVERLGDRLGQLLRQLDRAFGVGQPLHLALRLGIGLHLGHRSARRRLPGQCRHGLLAPKRATVICEGWVASLIAHRSHPRYGGPRGTAVRLGMALGHRALTMRNVAGLAASASQASPVERLEQGGDGAVEKTRTSTPFPGQRPQRCASTNSATTARDLAANPPPASRWA